MKKLVKLLGIIALVAVIGFSFAACSNGSTDSDPESQITFTNLTAPFVDGVYVAGEVFVPAVPFRYWAFGASAPVGDVITGAKLTGNSITLKVYELDYDSGVFSLYTGDVTIDGGLLYLFKLTATTYDTYAGSGFDDIWVTKPGKTVTFTNGTATVSLSDMEED